MFARVVIALGALAASSAQVWVDVVPNSKEVDEVEKRYTPELVSELHSAKEDALLLYTEYTARDAANLKIFLRTLANITNETLALLTPDMTSFAPEACQQEFEKRVQRISLDTNRAAGFSVENHHKFYLGHMIVFRMHLNKSEEYIKRCDRIIKSCGIPCETTTKVLRWRRLAKQEINRVRDDLQHSRLAYRDLLAHSTRRLTHLRRRVVAKTQEAVATFHDCVNRVGNGII